jgi:uncharacterized membrane protein YgcG
MSRSRWLSPFVLLLALVSLVRAEKEPPPTDLTDKANLFSKEAKDEVTPLLKEIRSLGKGLSFVIETFPDPGDDAPMEEKARNKFFGGWAEERAKELKVKGVYLLVCKNPRRFELLVDTKTTEQAFPETDRTELKSILATNFEKKDDNKALIAGVTFTRDRMKANVGTTSTTPSKPAESGWVYWASLIGLILLGLWVLIAAIRAVISAGIGEDFMPAFWSALLGAAVGLWLYENVFSRSGGKEGKEGGKEGKDEKEKDEGTEYSGAGEGKDV